MFVRDIRKFEEPIIAHVSEQASGICIPLYDLFSNALYLGKKGDNTIMSVDISKNIFTVISQYRGKWEISIINYYVDFDILPDSYICYIIPSIKELKWKIFVLRQLQHLTRMKLAEYTK